MERIAVLQLRDNLADILNRVAYTKGRFIVHRYGKVLAAIVPVESIIDSAPPLDKPRVKRGFSRRQITTAKKR